MSGNSAGSPLIVGIGNRYRSDDGIGPWVADRLRAAGLNAIEHSGEGAGLIDAWSGHDAVILVDAVQSGSPPGTIHRFDAATTELPKSFFRYSSHLFGVAEAIETARALGRLPTSLVVYGIEGALFAFGDALTPQVQEAGVDVANAITPPTTSRSSARTPE
ncbi:MAG TPA: hydrogenase maturation protease [Azospirillaceae bacterium]|nr:hydrogenase maturation protease [Azospirillaceae bacterium]